jgi:hypothetical protein
MGVGVDDARAVLADLGRRRAAAERDLEKAKADRTRLMLSASWWYDGPDVGRRPVYEVAGVAKPTWREARTRATGLSKLGTAEEDAAAERLRGTVYVRGAYGKLPAAAVRVGDAQVVFAGVNDECRAAAEVGARAGLDSPEIATLLGVTEATIRKWLPMRQLRPAGVPGVVKPRAPRAPREPRVGVENRASRRAVAARAAVDGGLVFLRVPEGGSAVRAERGSGHRADGSLQGGHGRGAHWPHQDGVRSACGRVKIDTGSGRPAGDVDERVRCRAAGCREPWVMWQAQGDTPPGTEPHQQDHLAA